MERPHLHRPPKDWSNLKNPDSPVDLQIPQGLNDDERREWLHNKVAELVEATGRFSAVTEHFINADGEESWVMWSRENPDEPEPDETDCG
jgi:hypothetical protein